MGTDESSNVVEAVKAEGATAQQEINAIAEASRQSQPNDDTNATPTKASGESKEVVQTEESSASGVKSDKIEPAAITNKPESKVHNPAHERDRELEASRRVEEAKKYNSERGSGRGDSRGGHKGQRSRGSFRGGRGNFKNNNRFDPSGLEHSSDPVAIRKQIEFYFSDSNLLTDKFLFEKVEGHKNAAVPIEVVHSFKRMQHFQPRSAIVDALKESVVLDLVEDDTAIQRKDALPKDLTGKSIDEVQKVYEDGSMARSIYAKGFGEEKSKTQFDIEAFFANYGPTNGVRLRRQTDKTFKGSVFVEFDSEETAKSFLALDPSPQWQGETLEIKSKKQYCDDKVEDINKGRIRRNSPNPRYDSNNNKRPRRSSPAYDDKKRDHADGNDSRDWRERRNEEAGNGFEDRPRRDNNRKSGRNDRGGNRPGKGGRDRNEEKRAKEEELSSPADPTHVRVTSGRAPSKDTAKEDDATVTTETAKTEDASSKDFIMAEDAASKKRAREDDGAEDGQGSAKKVDVKEDSGE